MQSLPEARGAEDKVLADIRRLVADIRDATDEDLDSTAAGIRLLMRLRQQVYEDLNQIQHEYLILRAAEWLRRNVGIEVQGRWCWNPRQTGRGTTPDLSLFLGEQQAISAEVTASENPRGAIDKRMAHTLANLSHMAGDKFYFVQTEQMRLRAETKVRTAGWQIRVVCLLPA